ncbi:MAG TPA: 3-hydroxyacyl-CoA dehydrogenase family protein [Candidatus Thermoplasmatota archaeon]|nr:3-hydroxyacyl-CoA dehydrogenase family protein [Candidatus Thermoplasmatota archaeon]
MVLFVETVGIVGAGVMGSAIAEIAALSGRRVLLHDADPDALARGRKRAAGLLHELADFQERKADREIERLAREDGVELSSDQQARLRERRRPTFTAARAAEALARVTAAPDLSSFSACDLVIEAVVEDVAVKREVLAKLESVAPRHAILATNTSSLTVSNLARALSRPQRFLGLHFFNPPSDLPLVEVVAGAQTDEAAVEDATAFVRDLRNHRSGMLPVRVKDGPGFLVNRVLGRMLAEAFLCLEDGVAARSDIDLAMRAGAGFPVGPLALADHVGLDVLAHAMRALDEQGFPREQRRPRVVDELVAAGRLGRKTGAGFYEYEPSATLR